MVALPHLGSGKVREIYRIDEEHLLFVASDRISAYDVILSPDIPDKGRVLTGLSLFWFERLDTPHHLVGTDLEGVEGLTGADREWLTGRSMIVRRAEVLPVECVVRGYLYGSAWREYSSGGGPSTEHLPAGLRQGDRLPAPVFTPASKAATGHDENLTEAEARGVIGDDVFEELRRRSLALYEHAAAHAGSRGLVLADTKFEFGIVGGSIVLVDEVLTPDSSRYWPASEWRPGAPIAGFDKQYVRDWLDSTGWDHSPPAPELPDEVVAGTRERYLEAYRVLTGETFDRYMEEIQA